jgi:hypothetical protein
MVLFFYHSFRRIFPLIFVGCIGVIVVLWFGVPYISHEIFGNGVAYDFYWFSIFFDPSASYPMQWFSGTSLSFITITMFFLLPLVSKKDILILSICVMFISVLLFIFRFRNILEYIPSRYLYHLYVYYVLVFAESINLCAGFIGTFKSRFTRFTLGVCGSTLLVFLFLIPQNVLHAAKHDLSLYGPNPDSRQISSLGNKDYLNELLDALVKVGVTNQTPLIAAEADIVFFIIKFDYKMSTRSYTTFEGGEYDTADLVYLQSKYWKVDEFDMAIAQHKHGYWFTNNPLYPKGDVIIKDTYFTYKASAQGYNIYEWGKAVSDTPAS